MCVGVLHAEDRVSFNPYLHGGSKTTVHHRSDARLGFDLHFARVLVDSGRVWRTRNQQKQSHLTLVMISLECQRHGRLLVDAEPDLNQVG